MLGIFAASLSTSAGESTSTWWRRLVLGRLGMRHGLPSSSSSCTAGGADGVQQAVGVGVARGRLAAEAHVPLAHPRRGELYELDVAELGREFNRSSIDL